MDEAAIVLWVIDEQPTAEECSEMQRLAKGKHLIAIFNKIDSKETERKLLNDELPTVFISAKLKAKYYSFGGGNL